MKLNYPIIDLYADINLNLKMYNPTKPYKNQILVLNNKMVKNESLTFVFAGVKISVIQSITNI